MEKEKIKKCYSCRKEIKGNALFCKKCEKDESARKHSVGPLVIYHKV